MMTYKGYTGHVEYDDNAELFHGEVVDTRDVITFQGTTVEEIETAFRDSIDDYLEFCRKRGEKRGARLGVILASIGAAAIRRIPMKM